MATKDCTRCKRILTVDNFAKCKLGRMGLNSWCRGCRTEANRERKRRHPEINREQQLQRKFGISHAQYEKMLLAQFGRCACCGSDSPGDRRKNFCVDHDHLTGRVRGLLCAGCNSGLGLLGDDPLRAANRLAKYSIIANAN